MLLAGDNMNLKEYLFLKRMSVKEFSEYMGYSRTHISAIINGHLKPSNGLAKAIERVTEGQVKAEELLKGKKN
jgi:DNA-binding transcriptional regulator YdaS (Cro superfamily)